MTTKRNFTREVEVTNTETVQELGTGDEAPTQIPKDTLEAPPPSRKRKPIAPYLLILPATAIVLLAMGYPLVWQLMTSMQHFGLAQQFGTAAPEWVWFDNYIVLFSDPYMWKVVFRSILFMLVAAVTTMVVGLIVALLMKAVPKAVRIIIQVALLLAWAMPVVAAMTVWTWLFDWRRGLINWVLTKMGFAMQGHNWLADPKSFFVVAAIIVIWMSVPFVAFSLYAGLTQVPEEILEAAEVDGATPFQQLRQIILPMIRPVIGIVFLLQIIWDLRVFTQIKLLQDQGSISTETNLLGTYIYQLGVGRSDFAMASAVSIFVLLLTIVLSAAYVRNLIKEDEN